MQSLAVRLCNLKYFVKKFKKKGLKFSMNLFNTSVFSETLQTTVSINIITPTLSILQRSGEKPGVLYLLHGFHGSHQSWITASNILRYCEEHNLVIVMPDMNNSFYVNNTAGIKYLDFCAYELVDFVEKTFSVSKRREDTFICGLSMGGYGAYRIAFERADKFFAAFSLSGALDVISLADNSEGMGWNETIENTFKLDFGPEGEKTGGENDLLYLAKKVSEKEVKPKLLQYCGRQDFLYDINLKFKSCVENLAFDYEYFESDGIHDWNFWDDKIRDVLKRIKEFNNRI